MKLIADSVFVFHPIYNPFQLKQIVATLFPAQMFILQFPFSDLIFQYCIEKRGCKHVKELILLISDSGMRNT